jgi:hypothetical protein
VIIPDGAITVKTESSYYIFSKVDANGVRVVVRKDKSLAVKVAEETMLITRCRITSLKKGERMFLAIAEPNIAGEIRSSPVEKITILVDQGV